VATITGLMTVEQYRQTPEGRAFYYELRNGELVEVSRPKMDHARKQRGLRKLLEAAYGERGVWETEVAFRALPEYGLCARNRRSASLTGFRRGGHFRYTARIEEQRLD
jgi:Uma2 family endonuclease